MKNTFQNLFIMTKTPTSVELRRGKQKILLWIFGLMFLIPEILWGDLIKISKISFLPIFKNVQYFTDNFVLVFLVILVEIIGVSGIICILNSKRRLAINNIVRYLLNALLTIILLALIISLYFSYTISRMTLF